MKILKELGEMFLALLKILTFIMCLVLVAQWVNVETKNSSTDYEHSI